MSELIKKLPESCRQHMKLISDGHIFTYDKITEWRGRRFEPVFPAKTTAYAYEHHQPLENDVLITSFKKTGTNWLREIVRQILYGREPELDRITKDISFPIVYLETGERKYFLLGLFYNINPIPSFQASKYEVIHNLPLPRRYHITHLPSALLNMERYKNKNMKFLFLLRNPKDQLVSFYHHMQSIPFHGDLAPYGGLSWNEFYEQEMAGRFPHSLRKGETYLDYILDWLPHIQNNENAMTIVYEEMVQDAHGHVKKIAQFLGEDLTDKEAKIIADNCSLQSMKDSAAEGESEDDIFHRSFGMIRKGKVGNWKEYFTVAQSETMDKVIRQKLGETGIKFIYE